MHIFISSSFVANICLYGMALVLSYSGHIVFEGECADECLLGWVRKKGMLELNNMPEVVHMNTEKATSKEVGR